jgi:hypothetical protein
MDGFGLKMLVLLAGASEMKRVGAGGRAGGDVAIAEALVRELKQSALLPISISTPYSEHGVIVGGSC